MKISIVTISFNQVQYLEDAILSVLNQSYSDVEYIVVDPGSTDGSRDIIEKYRDRIDIIIYKNDNGPAEGLNNGFSKATGDIYAFLNADDLLDSKAVEIIVDEFTKTDADVISGHGYIIDSVGCIVSKRYSHKFDLHDYVYGACVLFQQSTFFKSEIYKRVGGFNQDNHVSWDGELWFDMARSGAKFKRLHRYFSCFRIYDESITGSKKFTKMAMQVQERHAILLKVENWDSALRRTLQRIKARLLDPTLVARRVLDILDKYASVIRKAN